MEPCKCCFDVCLFVTRAVSRELETLESLILSVKLLLPQQEIIKVKLKKNRGAT